MASLGWTVIWPMRSTPEAPGETDATIEPALIEEWALSYLGRCASAAENLRRVLRRRVARRIGPAARIDDAARAAIDALVERYCAAGLLNDTAYAAGRARQGLARGRSLRRIAAGLAAKGIAAAQVTAALAGLRDADVDPELAAACTFARRRRIGPFRREPRGLPTDAAVERRRELAAFARAGFARRVAETVLGCVDAAAVAALLAGSASK